MARKIISNDTVIVMDNMTYQIKEYDPIYNMYYLYSGGCFCARELYKLLDSGEAKLDTQLERGNR